MDDSQYHTVSHICDDLTRNPFVRTQAVVDKAGNVLADQSISEGSFMQLKVHLPATMEETGQVQNTLVRATFIDHEAYRAAWCHVGLPSWLLHSERWQLLSQTEDGKTKYETIEVFGGVVAYLVKWLKGADLDAAFDAFAVGLKKRSEQA
ncbi:hypothetical protein QCA50_008087 [Cerrena zonata]|uniref:Uncharacterized protein n=1 Tax=Cerrena zonata TaxID=2478898 RepID=A0AAW0GB70_9APHY